jgi:Poly A polymerase regulatory subunit
MTTMFSASFFCSLGNSIIIGESFGLVVSGVGHPHQYLRERRKVMGALSGGGGDGQSADKHHTTDEATIEDRLKILTIQDLRTLASMLGISNRAKLTTSDKLIASILEFVTKQHTLSRQIDRLPDSVQFCDADTFYRLENALCSYNCHHGQRKLFFTMLEFLTICAKTIKLHDALVVYVGAAPGYNLRLIAELFPCVSYLLIDPASFDIKESNNLRIWHRIFTDETLEDVKRYKQVVVKKKHIIFVSDIRMTPKEEDIGQDMASQQRWGVLLQSAAMMFKFRLPYYGTSLVNDLVLEAEQQLMRIKDLVEMPASKPKMQHAYLYLDGTVLTQLYAPLRSAETRLIVFHPAYKPQSMNKDEGPAVTDELCITSSSSCVTSSSSGPGPAPRGPAKSAASVTGGGGSSSEGHPLVSDAGTNKYGVKYWDYKKYEAKMNAFNIVCRSLLSYKSYADPDDSNKLGEHLLGYGSDYESVAEYQLAKEYLAWYKRCYYQTHDAPTPSSHSKRRDWLSYGSHGGDRNDRSYHPAFLPLTQGLHVLAERNIEPSLEHVVRFLHRLNMRFVSHYSSKVSLVLCAIKTMAVHIRKHNEMDEARRVEQMQTVSKVVLARFQKQMEIVRRGNILTTKEKQDMVESVAKEVEYLNKE